MRTTTAAMLWAAACIAVPASAQVAPIEATDQIDEIVVVGARTPVPVARLGNATTVISRSDIERRQVRYVTDVLRSVPGVAVAKSGGIGSQTQVRIRGSEANHILVLIDGVRANDPATGDEFRWEQLTTSNVERIEIVRGPQSALWGSDAISAVINVVSRTGAESASLDSFVESGANDAMNLGASGRGSVGNWTFGGGVESLQTDGENISRTGTERDGSELSSASLSARYTGDESWRFDLGLRAVEAMSEFDPIGAFTTGLPVDGDVVTDSDSVVGGFGATFNPAGRTTWQMRVRLFESEHRNFIDDVQDSSTASDRISYALQANVDLDGNTLTFALEHEDTEFAQRGAVVFGDPNQDQDMQVTSLTGEYQHVATDRLSWILSGRFDKNSEFDDALTGRLTSVYQWSDSMQLRGSIGTGQKIPTFTERFGFFPAQFIGNADLKPEKSLSVDLGVEKTLLDGALTLEAMLFRQALEDEINGFVFDPVTFLATAANRPGESDRSGVELGARWRIDDRLSLGASYTHIDAYEDDDLGQRLREIRRPEHAGNVTLDYAPPSGRFQATLIADYGGSRLDTFFPPFPQPQRSIVLDGYWLVDLTLQYRISESVSIFARGTNLLDEQYEQVFGYNTLGRAGYVGIRADFGRLQ